MLTSEQIVEEYIKCISDPIYVIETYLKTYDKTQEGYVPFILFPRQKEIVEGYEGHRFNLVTKPRQAGVSMLTAAHTAIKTSFADKNNPEKVLIVANKQIMAQEFLSRTKAFLLQIPRWVWGSEYVNNPKKSIFINDSKGHLKLPNDSEIKAVATSEDALRGFTPTRFILDEAAFLDKTDSVGFFTSAMSSLGTGGRCTLISTPNGMDPLYYKTYEMAKTGKNDFNVIEMHWYEDLRYNKDLRWIKSDDETKEREEISEKEFTFESYDRMVKKGYKPTSTWYEQMCRSMNNNPKMIAQELDVSFIGSGGNVIEDKYIAYHEENNVIDPLYFDGVEKEYWIWEKPIEGHRYVLSTDPSRGDGEDYSSIVIIDFTTMRQVMEYQGKVAPDVLGEIVYKYGELYDAYTVVDITGGMGVATVLKLLEMGYKRLHYDDPKSKLLETRSRLDNYSKDGDKIPGFNMGTVRLPMIANLERAIRENDIVIRSARLIAEMRRFVYRNGRPDHMKGSHDDILIALAMGLWVIEHSFKNLKTAQNKSKAILDSWVVGDVQTKVEEQYIIKKDGKKEKVKPKIESGMVVNNVENPNNEHLWLFSGLF